MSSTPHSNDPRDHEGEYVLGKDGKPLVDRYGRPIRRRPVQRGVATPRPEQHRQVPEFTRVERPERPARLRQEYQPRRTPEHTRYDDGREARQSRPQRPRQEFPEYQPRRTPQRSRPAPQSAPEPVPSQVSRRRRKGPARRRKAKAPGCTTILAILAVLLIAGTLLADARLTRTHALPHQQIANTAGTNWLLVGSDSRTGLSDKDVERLGTGGDLGTTRTDTIMLLHIPLTGNATLVSIPRDSYVPIPGYGYDKINAAFAFGGAPLLAQTVEENTGLRVDRYAEIGMGGLANVVDAVGGVEICVDEAIDDPLANLSVQPGCQNMDGPTSLGYVRTRATAQGDLDRVIRQREFLGALLDRVTSPAVLVNPFRLVPLLWTAPTMFVVGDGDHIWHLIRIPLAMRSGLDTETIPLGGFQDTEVGNVVLWDDAAAEELFASLR